MFEGSRKLSYGVISDGKMKFLEAANEKFSVFYKNFFLRASTSRKFSHILIRPTKRSPCPPSLTLNVVRNMLRNSDISVLKFNFVLTLNDNFSENSTDFY